MMKRHTPESLRALREHIKEHLDYGGYRPLLTADGEVMFHFDGKMCYLQTEAADPMHLRLVLVNFHPIPDKNELARVSRAADEATGSTKVVKIYTQDGDTWCVADFLLPDPAQVTQLISRTLSAMRAALRAFEKELARDDDNGAEE